MDSRNTFKNGFTLIELMVVIIITIASLTATWISIRYALDKGHIGESVAFAKLIADSSDLYLTDMGYYPPDVDRGCDPGFVQEYPTPEPGGWNCNVVRYIPQHTPGNWESLLNERWLGPYLKDWPVTTPWGGKYDYNFWPNGKVRYGVCVPPGIYIGIQGDYSNNNIVPDHVEQRLLDDGLDYDKGLNGEVQLLVQVLETTTPDCTP